MMMKKSPLALLKIASLIVMLLACLIDVQNCFSNSPADAFLEKNYIYDKNIPPPDIKAAPSDSPYLSGGRVTAETLSLFRSLERKYAVNSLEELSRHYELAYQDLIARFKPAEAQQLYAHYQKYLACQIAIVNDSRFETKSMDPKELLVQLYHIQNFRREKLGRETADALFGKEVKDHEYLLRRLIIIGSPEPYGKEKEQRLQKLKSDMWGDKAISIGEDQEPYNLYELKMQLYARDLSEMSENNRKLKIEEFRKEFFTPEQIDRLHQAEAEVAAEDEILRRYRAEEKKIREADGMPEDQRNQAIKTLQDQYFGSEADAFRRREAIRQSFEKKPQP